MLPSSIDEIKYLDQVFKTLIKMKLEIQDVLKELRDASWDSDEEKENIDLRKKTFPKPKITKKRRFS
jgi:hypothetical protein